MAIISLGTSIVLVLLMISLVGLGHYETLAQGTNATTNSTNATSGINVTNSSGGRAGKLTVVMLLGSSNGTVQTGYGPGYDPYAITVSLLNGTGYAVESGTSMAAPQVAGAAALYKAMFPDATPAEVTAKISAASTHPDTQCDGSSQGYFTGDTDGVKEPLLFQSLPIL